METKQVLCTVKKYEKKPKTKTTYNLISTESEVINKEHFENSTSKDWGRIFKRLGGSFTRQFAYTSQGYNCIKTVSVSPCKKNKTIHEYKFL
jgi:hypothetical protein